MPRRVITHRQLKLAFLFLLCVCLVILLATFIVPSIRGDFQFTATFLHSPVVSRLDDDLILRLDGPLKQPFCPETLDKPIGRIRIDRQKPTWDQLMARFAMNLSNADNRLNQSVSNTSIALIPATELKNSTGPATQTVNFVNQTAVGLWSPIECIPKEKLVIILPFRDRDEHLRIFLNHMHPFLRHQRLMYTILVVEQLGQTRFNRAALFNVGFRESSRIANFDCFFFHDVDLLPEDDRLPYRCGSQPIHMSVAVDSMNYKLLYPGLFGGVVAFSRAQFERVRGFSNVFFGWGGEDDDLYSRVRHYKYKVFRHPSYIARYTMVRHKRDKLNPENPERHKMLKSSAKRFSNDGYPESEYTVKFAGPKYNGLVYWISIELDEKNILKRLNVTT